MSGKVLFKGGPFSEEIWKPYKVTLNFVSRLCGSTPANKEMLQGWLDSRKPSVRPPSGKTIAAVVEEVANRLEDQGASNDEAEKKSTVTFQSVDNKLVVPAFTVRAHIKDCTSQVQNQLTGRIKGERNFTTRVKNGLYVKGDFTDPAGTDVISMMRSGKPVAVAEIDGYQERTVHASTPQGPISAIKKFAYVLKPTLTFVVSLLGESVKPQDLALVLQYGATHGYGGERSMGEGRYQYTIEEA